LRDEFQNKSETAPSAGPTLDDDLVQFGASSTAARQQLPIIGIGTAESLEVALNDSEDPEVPEQQSPPSQHHMPARTLPHGFTIILVRNVPARLSNEQVLEVWAPGGMYNPMLVPFNFQRRRRCGKAIINMISYEAAVDFIARWHGKKLLESSRARCLHVDVAPVQGILANLRQLRKSMISCPWCSKVYNSWTLKPCWLKLTLLRLRSMSWNYFSCKRTTLST